MINFNRLIILSLFISSCQPPSPLKTIADINSSLKEVSAAEITSHSEIIWAIEDSGNNNNLYGLNEEGNIIRDIDISNAKNNDWEDLTSDESGNIYIGDFGNNNKKRSIFRILKIKARDLNNDAANAEVITFTLPKGQNAKDFEAFFLYQNYFYIFSKETKKFLVFKVPNQVGEHTAVLRSDYNLKGGNNKITAADISPDGKTVVLLNHDKLWKLTGFTSDDFFSGSLEDIRFEHSSQKEGIGFKDNHTVIITDERNNSEGGNIYTFELNRR